MLNKELPVQIIVTNNDPKRVDITIDYDERFKLWRINVNKKVKK